MDGARALQSDSKKAGDGATRGYRGKAKSKGKGGEVRGRGQPSSAGGGQGRGQPSSAGGGQGRGQPSSAWGGQGRGQPSSAWGGQGRGQPSSAWGGQGRGQPSSAGGGQGRGQPSSAGGGQGRGQPFGAGGGQGRGQPSSAQHEKKQRDFSAIFDKKLDPPFEPYWSREEVGEGLKRGQLLKGTLRINPKSFQDAYIDDPAGGPDIWIQGVSARNRALHGDVVVLEYLPKEQWEEVVEMPVYKAPEEVFLVKEPSAGLPKAVSPPPGAGAGPIGPSLPVGGAGKRGVEEPPPTVDKQRVQIKRKAKVVHIYDKRHCRVAPGTLGLFDKSQNRVLFSPRDPCVPRVVLPLDQCPKDFPQNPKKYDKTLFLAAIGEWTLDSPFVKGHLVRSIGEGGQIEPETEAILLANDICDEEIADSAIESIKVPMPWSVPEEERQVRRDFTKECVVSIDPDTARDLDDALHCKPLPGGGDRWEVGVHIADVTAFLRQRSELDKVAQDRATSVYLVQRVIPMLPRILCEQLCSLNPSEERLTFSVVWEMNSKGEIANEWIGRGIIKSCAKLSYDQAQVMLDNPDKVWTLDELPTLSGDYTPEEITKSVCQLNKIAVCLRQQRFETGSLRLEQPKLYFTMDLATGLPNGTGVYERKDSHKLIEEFMLLANMATARKIAEAFPNTALLRRHEAPKEHLTDKLEEVMDSLGMPVDATSAGTIHESLKKHQHGDFQQCDLTQLILTVYCAKVMETAEYFCTGTVEDRDEWKHYALNVPFYTHFTSPIRRYADVMVHRLLAECLGVGPKCEYSMEEVDAIATHCNKKKMAAKKAETANRELFFAAFVQVLGEVHERGMVIQVLDKSFDVVVAHYGTIQRVHTDRLKTCGLRSFVHQIERKRQILLLKWDLGGQHIQQEITVFSEVDVVLTADSNLKLCAVVTPPKRGKEQVKGGKEVKGVSAAEKQSRQSKEL